MRFYNILNSICLIIFLWDRGATLDIFTSGISRKVKPKRKQSAAFCQVLRPPVILSTHWQEVLLTSHLSHTCCGSALFPNPEGDKGQAHRSVTHTHSSFLQGPEDTVPPLTPEPPSFP